ncbi:MAG: response regulator [Candidatus Marinimicrobia bacterium]|nr:response regulator [Candidatus Neomarinimicrobiota bacterium]
MSKILIVDDEPGIRRILRKTLEDEGYTVFEAADGRECITQQRKHRPKLVIIDILMPIKDGFETIKELKKEFPETIIFAMSGATYEGSTEKLLEVGRKLGARRTFQKPLDMEEILNAVKEWLDKPMKAEDVESKAISVKQTIPVWLWIIFIFIALILGFILGNLGD